MKGRITIDVRLKEDLFIEGLLNTIASGFDIKVAQVYLFLYAMGYGWKMDKVLYYNKLMEDVK